MLDPEVFEEVRSRVRSREELLVQGWTERGLSRAASSGRLLRLGRGRYLESEEWRALSPELRLLARVVATAPAQGPRAAFCLESAAVLHGLPLYGFRGRQVHVLQPGRRSATASPQVKRYVAGSVAGDVTTVLGLPCTTLDRTVLDLARLAPDDRALVCLDAAVRRRFPVPRGEPTSAEARVWLGTLAASPSMAPGARGRRKAARLLALADAGAESPLESVARLRLRSLGYDVATQVAVRAPHGGWYHFDLELEGLDVLCEVDGRRKYVDTGMRRGRSAEQVLVEEKRREDWARGTTGKRVIRLMAREVETDDALRRTLRAYRVPPPPVS